MRLMKNSRVANGVKGSSSGFTVIANLRGCETCSTLRLCHKNTKPWDKYKCAQIDSERHSDSRFLAPGFRHLERVVKFLIEVALILSRKYSEVKQFTTRSTVA